MVTDAAKLASFYIKLGFFSCLGMTKIFLVIQFFGKFSSRISGYATDTPNSI